MKHLTQEEFNEVMEQDRISKRSFVRGKKADFTNISLNGLDLSGHEFEKISFKGADLRYTILKKTRFYNCDIDGADFDKAYLLGIVLSDTETDKAENLDLSMVFSISNTDNSDDEQQAEPDDLTSNQQSGLYVSKDGQIISGYSLRTILHTLWAVEPVFKNIALQHKDKEG